MSPDNSAVPGADGGVPAWEQVMRAMLGEGADEAIRELQERGFDPGAMAAASGLPDDPAALQQVFAQVQSLLAASGDDPVNWQMAHDLARQQAAAGGDPSADRRAGTPGPRRARRRRAVARRRDGPAAVHGHPAGLEPRGVGRGDPADVAHADRAGGVLAVGRARRGARRTPCPTGRRRTSRCPAASTPASSCASSGPPCSACRWARPRARSRTRCSAPPTSGSRCSTGRRPRSWPPTSTRSPRASTRRPRRSGCSSPCARPPPPACSRTCRGCARTCSPPWRPTRAASPSTPTSSRRPCARST